MLPTQAMLWSPSKIKQCEDETGQALLRDEQTLVSFSQDFGKILQSKPSAVFIPENIKALQTLISFAYQQKLPITIRGNGLSQSGQSLPVPGGVIVSMRQFAKPLELDGDSIWVEANTTWAKLLEKSLSQAKAPFILPYNCNLTVGGVLSAGGFGSSSFKFGSINAHVQALEVVTGAGVVQVVDKSSPLFHACLSGQGCFAVITKAQIQLKPVKPRVKTFCLVYTDYQQWLADSQKLRNKVDYMELFCSPSMQGTKFKGEKRVPLIQWLYGMHLSIEFEEASPHWHDIAMDLKPWQLINSQEESIASYFLRNDMRFEMMKVTGLWELSHPWYECLIPTSVLEDCLAEILDELPSHYANMVHIAHVAPQKAQYLMFPEHESISSLMILNPGVIEPFKDSCLQAIRYLDGLLLKKGGKRYLSGFLGKELPESYWAEHFGNQYQSWKDLKKQYDPEGIFTSLLHPGGM